VRQRLLGRGRRRRSRRRGRLSPEGDLPGLGRAADAAGDRLRALFRPAL